MQQWYQHKIVLMAVTFPIYAAQGWPAQINGSGSSGDDLTELTIAHTQTPDADLFEQRPQIQVTTSTEEPRGGELAIARRVLEHWVDDESNRPRWGDLSDAAITLRFRAVHRAQRAAATNALRSETQIIIDGGAEPFVTLTTPERPLGSRSPSRRPDRHDRRSTTSSPAASSSNHSPIQLRPCPAPSRTRPDTTAAPARGLAPTRRFRCVAESGTRADLSACAGACREAGAARSSSFSRRGFRP